MFGKNKKVAFSAAALEVAFNVALGSGDSEQLEKLAGITTVEQTPVRDKIALALMDKAVATPFNDFSTKPSQSFLLAQVMRVTELGISKEAAEQLLGKMIDVDDLTRASRIAVNSAKRTLTEADLERSIAVSISFGNSDGIREALTRHGRKLTLQELTDAFAAAIKYCRCRYAVEMACAEMPFEMREASIRMMAQYGYTGFGMSIAEYGVSPETRDYLLSKCIERNGFEAALEQTRPLFSEDARIQTPVA